MIKPFTYEDEPWLVRDNIALVQALERCSAAYRKRTMAWAAPYYSAPRALFY